MPIHMQYIHQWGLGILESDSKEEKCRTKASIGNIVWNATATKQIYRMVRRLIVT